MSPILRLDGYVIDARRIIVAKWDKEFDITLTLEAKEMLTLTLTYTKSKDAELCFAGIVSLLEEINK